MSQRTTANNIVSFLRDKITDPLSRSVEFIFIGYPRSISMSFPRVSVTPVGGGRAPMSMGSAGNRFTLSYQIDIYTDTDANADIGGGEVAAQVELINYLADQVKDVFRDDNCEFRDTYDCLDAWVEPIRILPYDEELDLYRGVFTLIVQINDPPA